MHSADGDSGQTRTFVTPAQNAILRYSKVKLCATIREVLSTRLGPIMKLTNDSYVIRIGTKNFTERYFRDKIGWVKISARRRKFRMTAEQVLNHLLPALAGIKPNLTIEVEHRDAPED